MLNKKLVLGSLAGATLLVGGMIMAPAAQAASIVSGSCVQCHTMHDSVDGVETGTQYNQLLNANGCIGCHDAGTNNASGVGGPQNAPQVTDSANPNAGGYFSTTDEAKNHSLEGEAGWTVTANLATAPGGGPAAATFGCTSCHAGTGHHSATKGQRLLPAGAISGPADYGTTGTVATYGLAMNTLCATCHPDFHSGANTGTATGAFTRHPTGVDAVLGGGTTSVVASSFLIPVTAANQVLCVSCHNAHGSDELDLLKFNYASIKAGDVTGTDGCERCHGAK